MVEQAYDSAHDAKADPCYPEFYMKEVLDKHATREAGANVYKDMAHVRIFIPGDKLNVPCRPVTEIDKRRWKQQWEDFQAGNEQRPDGYPLSAWPGATPAFVRMLKEVKVFTVEQLAGMAEANLPKFPEINRLQKKAQEFLAAQTDSAEINRLQNDNEQMTDRLQAMEEAMEKLKGQLDEQAAEEEKQQDPTPRRRGRPPKGKTEG